MNNTKKLAAHVAGVMAVAAFLGVSAFAETRHLDATQGDREQRSDDRRDSRADDRQNNDRHVSRDQVRQERLNQDRTNHDRSNNDRWSHDRNSHDRNNNDQTFHRRDERDQRDAREYRGNDDRSQAGTFRNNDRGTYRNDGRYDSRSQADTYRNNNRGSERSQGYHSNRPAYDDRGRRSENLEGRINHFKHEHGGYRVWLDGGRFPVWIPDARLSLFPRLRIGLSLNFGGYYDPRGYLEAYDYYDGYGRGYDSGAYSSGLLRGIVETVDYRRGTMVVRDDVSGNFVTAIIRDRRLESLRPGDYAEIAGDWTRSGLFEGLRLEDVQGGRY